MHVDPNWINWESLAESWKARADRATAVERERCAKIAENPGFIEARDTDWDLGVNYAKRFIAAAIRSQS